MLCGFEITHKACVCVRTRATAEISLKPGTLSKLWRASRRYQPHACVALQSHATAVDCSSSASTFAPAGSAQHKQAQDGRQATPGAAGEEEEAAPPGPRPTTGSGSDGTSFVRE